MKTPDPNVTYPVPGENGADPFDVTCRKPPLSLPWTDVCFSQGLYFIWLASFLSIRIILSLMVSLLVVLKWTLTL